jgi:hypothetical protein
VITVFIAVRLNRRTREEWRNNTEEGSQHLLRGEDGGVGGGGGGGRG